MKPPGRKKLLPRKLTKSYWNYCLIFVACFFRDKPIQRYAGEDQKIQIELETSSQQISCEATSILNKTKDITCHSWYSSRSSPSSWNYLRVFYENKNNFDDLDAIPIQSMILSISCKKPVRYDVYFNGRYVIPINVDYSQEVFVLKGRNPELSDDQYISNLYLQETGANYYDAIGDTLYVLLEEGQEIEVRHEDVLVFSLIFPVELDSTNRAGPKEVDLIQAVSSLLGLPPDGARIVEIGCCREKRSLIRNQVNADVRVQVGNPRTSTDGSVEITTVNSVENYVDVLASAVQSGHMDKLVKHEVHSLRIRNHNGGDMDTVIEGTTLKRTRRQNNQNPSITSDSSSYQTPYNLLVCREDCTNTEAVLTVYEPLAITLVVKDANDKTVTTFDKSASWKAKVSATYGESVSELDFEGTKEVSLVEGMANFTDLRFIKAKDGMFITFAVYNGTSSINSSKPLEVVFGPINVKHRPLKLRQVSNGVPYNVKENGSLGALVGVTIIDGIDNQPANTSVIGNGTWKANVDFLYENVYGASIIGEKKKVLQNGNNEFLFPDLKITKWGYRYYLKITVTDDSKLRKSMDLTIGPFDVGKAVDENTVVVTSKTNRLVTMKFSQDYSLVSRDTERFHVFFLNKFGRMYPEVEWMNFSSSAGSVVTNTSIQGTVEALDKTKTALLASEAEFVYDGNSFSRTYVAVNKEQDVFTAGQPMKLTSNNNVASEGLPPAWIAAIAINCALVFLFIIFLIYCYCNKRKSTSRNSDIIENSFLGEPDPMYSGKSGGSPIQQTYASSNRRPSFRNDVDNYSIPFGSRPTSRVDPRCTCNTPECYCDDPSRLDPNLQNSHPPNSPATIPEVESQQQLEKEEEEENLDDLIQETIEETDDFRTDNPSYSRNSSRSYSLDDVDLPVLPGTIEKSEISDHEDDLDDIIEVQQNKKKYLVYLMLDEDGSRECIGHVWLPHNNPVTLTQVRNYLAAQATPSVQDVIQNKFNFVNESFREITFQEGALLVDRIYPSHGINIRLVSEDELRKEKKEKAAKKAKTQRYYGPMGKCTEPNCEKSARIKCMDCGLSAYCGTRCLRIDGPSHKKVCYRAPWKI
ncbi:uncharacterized protein LOC143229327 isoform X2 [Tachypleus tridentatus]|uniref:uncharacterized protein LOC143229327 isoform X2 n=1 Tax=Tachypleus tridentatus TaxID=6853 RepID=UPI003FD2CE7B